jgi:hypothetical protein
MGQNLFTETTTEGLGSRLGGSIKGIFFGLILFVVAFPLLFWNEGRAVKRYQSLLEGQGIVVSIQANELLTEYQDKLVHFSGMAISDETLQDDQFGISTEGLRLSREVEMYQWQEEERTETKTNTGGSETKKTTYEYTTAWSGSIIDSSGFRYPQEHTNPGTMPFRSQSSSVSDARVGQVQLPQDLLSRIGGSQRMSIEGASIPDAGRAGQAAGDYIYYGADPGMPQVGDLRVSFSVVPESTISVVAKLTGQSLAPYTTEVGGNLYMLDDGSVTAEAMFASEHQANTILTWVLRVVGFVVMWIGLASLFGPLRVLADILPFLGRIVGAGIGLVSAVLAFALSGLTISIAWLFYRPVLAVVIMAVSGGAVYWLTRKSDSAPEPVPTGAAATPPPPPPGP